jgi:hypothetical protein
MAPSLQSGTELWIKICHNMSYTFRKNIQYYPVFPEQFKKWSLSLWMGQMSHCVGVKTQEFKMALKLCIIYIYIFKFYIYCGFLIFGWYNAKQKHSCIISVLVSVFSFIAAINQPWSLAYGILFGNRSEGYKLHVNKTCYLLKIMCKTCLMQILSWWKLCIETCHWTEFIC